VMGALAALVILGVSQPTRCDSASEAGLYQGTAESRASGQLDVSLNLRCAAGELQGALLTPVGNFALTHVDVSPRSLTIRFDAGGDVGTLEATRAADSLTGTFVVAGDTGSVSLHRIGPPRLRDIPIESLELQPNRWREDIDFFARELPLRHAAPFAHYSRDDFQKGIASLEDSLGTLTPDQVYVRLDAIANRVGDGHTFVALPSSHSMFPIAFRRFGADYRVVSTTAASSRALGARLIGIGTHDVAHVRARLLTLTPSAETMALRDARVTDFLGIGAMLHGLNLVADANEVVYRLQSDGGKIFELRVQGMSASNEDRTAWQYVVPSQPLSRGHSGESFWFVSLPAAHLVYCNWRAYDSLPNRAARLLALIDSVKPRAVLIDMRQNGGGDYTLGLKYVIEPLSQRRQSGALERLYVAIGTNTFSAGMSNSAQFRTRAQAMLIGEPIGERPNSYQEAREMRLPNSWLMVRYSTRFYRFVDKGPNEIRPDVAIATSWSAYKAGRDPVLEWVERRDSSSKSLAGH